MQVTSCAVAIGCLLGVFLVIPAGWLVYKGIKSLSGYLSRLTIKLPKFGHLIAPVYKPAFSLGTMAIAVFIIITIKSQLVIVPCGQQQTKSSATTAYRQSKQGADSTHIALNGNAIKKDNDCGCP